MCEHICEVCFLPSWQHEDPAHWPPRCCEGCSCGATRPDEEDESKENQNHS